MRLNKEQKQRAIREFYMKHDIFSVSDIKRKALGYFFSPDTMRFFNCKVVEQVFAGINNVYFVTSEKFFSNHGDVRKYTVRKYDVENRSVETIGEFGAYNTRTTALTAALNCAFDESSEFINIT